MNILYPEFKAVRPRHGQGYPTQASLKVVAGLRCSGYSRYCTQPQCPQRFTSPGSRERSKEVYWIIGASADKDVHGMMELLPEGDHYIWVSTSNARTLKARQLQEIASKTGKRGKVFEDVNSALEHTKAQLNIDDMI